MTDSIELHNLAIGYHHGKEQIQIMSGISAQIKPGCLTCLIGNNGAGKSTLLRTLAAFQPKLSGEIMIRGRELSDYSRNELSRLIGVVLTERPSVQNLSVFDMVAMGRSPYTGFFGTLTAADRNIVANSIHLVGIDHLSSRMVHTLSDGERQKMMTAKALAQQTAVIYLDEPTSFLDYGSKVDTLQMLHRLSAEQQKTIFLSTHDLELALQIADELWVMTDGKVITGSPCALADDGTLSAFIDKRGITFCPDTMTIRIK